MFANTYCEKSHNQSDPPVWLKVVDLSSYLRIGLFDRVAGFQNGIDK